MLLKHLDPIILQYKHQIINNKLFSKLLDFWDLKLKLKDQKEFLIF